MSRSARKPTTLSSGIVTEQTLANGLYAALGALNHLQEGGNAFTKSGLSALPGYALLHGVFTLVDGIADIRAGCRQATAIDAAEAAKTKQAQSNLPSVSLKRYIPPPSVLITQQILPFAFYSPKELYIRGALKILSGAFLAEGAAEALLGKNLIRVDIFWRLAIHSMAELALALYDAGKLCGVDQDWKESNANEWSKLKEDVISNLVVKGLNCVGWTALAIGGPIAVPIAFACLALSALISAYKNRAQIGMFFSNVKASVCASAEPSAPSHTPSSSPAH